VDGKSFSVVGVMKKGFDFPMPAEAWIPLALNVKERLQRDNSPALGAGTAQSQAFLFPRARGDASSLQSGKRKAYPDTNKSLASAPTTACDNSSPER